MNFARLKSAITASTKALRPFRERRVEFVKEYVGAQYSDDGASDRVPWNFIEQALGIYMQNTAAHVPRYLCTTDRMELKPVAALIGLALNKVIRQMDLEATMRRAVLDAMLSVGLVKIGLTAGSELELEGEQVVMPEQFVEVVDLDDWVHDITAHRWNQMQFCGNRARVPLAMVKASPLYDPAITDKLQATDRGDTGFAQSGEDLTEDIGRGSNRQLRDEYQDTVELWEIWLPFERKIVTLTHNSEAPLRVTDWDGPPNGPYRMLRFLDVPNNLMPLAPAALWYDLHILGNQLYNKLGRQAVRQKEVTAYQRGHERDARSVAESPDGSMIAVDDPNAIQKLKSGGADQGNQAFFLGHAGLASRQAGNLDAMGGLSPQSRTATQDEMLNANSSKRLQDMQQITVKFAREIGSDLAWYLWNDALAQVHVTQPFLPGEGLEREFTADEKRGDIQDYEIEVEPYSMQMQTPQSRLNTLMQILKEVVMPLAGQLQAEGRTVNASRILEVVAELTDSPYIAEILAYGPPPQAAEAPSAPASPAAPAGLPRDTKRTYERVNRPGGTREGHDAALMQALLGQRAQKAELEGVGRPDT